MRRPTALLIAVLVAVGGCASKADEGAVERATTTTTSGSKPVPEPGRCSADDLEADALEPLMLDDREGFEKQTDDVADTGPSDLAKAIRDDEQADAEQVLTDLGFRRGYQRYWTNLAGNEVVDFVYEFCDDQAASTYLDRVFANVPGLEPFEVVGAPGARGISGVTQGVVVAFAGAVTDGTLVFSLASGQEGTVLRREAQARATALVVDQVAVLDEVG